MFRDKASASISSFRYTSAYARKFSTASASLTVKILGNVHNPSTLDKDTSGGNSL